jgi:hypothetical protein
MAIRFNVKKIEHGKGLPRQAPTEKKKMRTTLLILFATLSMNVAFAQKSIETVEIQTSAVCDMCKETIEKQLAFTKGVTAAELDVKTSLSRTEPLLKTFGYRLMKLVMMPMIVKPREKPIKTCIIAVKKMRIRR